MMNVTTISELLNEDHRITGEDLEKLLDSIINGYASDEEKDWAHQLYETYWVNNGEILPISTAYYSIDMNKRGEIGIHRDSRLSPRVSDFMNLVTLGAYSGTLENDGRYTGGDLRTVIVLILSITGDELGRLCFNILKGDEPVESYVDYQKQLARGILDKYYTDGRAVPKDDVFYKVKIRQVGVPNVLRDLDRSPRTLPTTEE